MNNPINLVDLTANGLEVLDFGATCFFTDKRNEAKLMAGQNSVVKKTDDGWTAARRVENNAENDGVDTKGSDVLDEIEITYIEDDGERSFDDRVVNIVRGMANTGIIVGTALVMPFVVLAKNKNIDWAAGDKMISANPYQLSEDVGFEQMDGSTQEIGVQAMKSTIGLIFIALPTTLPFWEGQAVTTAASEGVNIVIDEVTKK